MNKYAVVLTLLIALTVSTMTVDGAFIGGDKQSEV